MTVANVQILLKRGNSTISSTYTGPLGELTMDTTLYQLRLHDGATPGGILQADTQDVTAANLAMKGYVDQANTIQSGQVGAANLAITAANLGMKGYVDQANTIQSAQVGAANLAITAANVGMKGYVDSVASIASQSTYGNSNVKLYLTVGIDGNIIPSANVTYSLGSITNQWKDLWVSGNTINIGGTALSVTDNSLSINGSKIGAQKAVPANIEGAAGDTIGDVAYQTNYATNGSFNVYNYYCMQTFTGVITYSGIRGVSGGSASAVLRVSLTHNNPDYAFPQAANVRVGWTMEGSPITGIATITSIQASTGGDPTVYYYEYTINQAVDLRDATGITVKGRPAIWVRSTMSTW
jgi:hypothetical protein